VYAVTCQKFDSDNGMFAMRRSLSFGKAILLQKAGGENPDLIADMIEYKHSHFN